MTEKPHYTGHRQRLREKFLKSGKDALADYELLELILYGAKPRGDTKPLAKELIKKFGSLAGVIKADINELNKIKGLGEAGITTIKLHKAVAVELLKNEIKEEKDILSSWKSLLNYCKIAIQDEKKEEFRILFLNKQNELIADEIQQFGTIDHVMVYPREVVKRALELCSSAIIMVHNHPSGNPTPSQSDMTMTVKIKSALLAVDIKLHDHLILGGDEHYSFSSYGIL